MGKRILVGTLVVGIMAGLVALPLLDAPVLAGGNKHVQEAVEHANEAIDHGSQGHADALVMHAEVALKHAKMAQKEMMNPHLDEGNPRSQGSDFPRGGRPC